MKRELHGIEFEVSSEALERSNGDLRNYYMERSLRDLGFEYVKKYSTLKTSYKYFDRKKNEMVIFKEIQEDDFRYEFLAEVIRLEIR